MRNVTKHRIICYLAQQDVFSNPDYLYDDSSKMNAFDKYYQGYDKYDSGSLVNIFVERATAGMHFPYDGDRKVKNETDINEDVYPSY